MRERWLVVWNCQAFGFANCIQTLARDVECEALDFWAFGKALEAGSHDWRSWDRIIFLRDACELPGFDAAQMPEFEILPPLRFGGYHPDCCYVLLNDETISDGVIGPYNSMIAFAAYKEGLDAEQAARWYNAATYAHADYFAPWPAERQMMLNRYRKLGLDVSRLFRVTGRGQSFMHTVNHPKIEALFELARALLVARGRPIFEGIGPPPDNLATSTWPIYPEIGEPIGVPGSYLFKPANQHKPLELVDYLERSLAYFSGWGRDQLQLHPSVEPQLQDIRRLMRGEVQ